MVSFLRMPLSRFTKTFIRAPVSVLPFMMQSTSPSLAISAAFWMASVGSGTWMIIMPSAETSLFRISRIAASSPIRTGSTMPSLYAWLMASSVCSSCAGVTATRRFTGMERSISFNCSKSLIIVFPPDRKSQVDYTSSGKSAGSVTTPMIAVAAATAGLDR